MNKTSEKIEQAFKSSYLEKEPVECNPVVIDKVMAHIHSRGPLRQAFSDVNDSMVWKLVWTVSAVAVIMMIMYLTGIADTPSTNSTDEILYDNFSNAGNIIAGI